MGKTREQLLNEKKIEIETNQMPTRLKMDSLSVLKDILQTTKPMQTGFVDEQKWESVWSDDELNNIKIKILSIIRDL